MLTYGWLALRNKLQWIFNQNITIFIQQNVYENIVCKIGGISFGPVHDYEEPSWGTNASTER